MPTFKENLNLYFKDSGKTIDLKGKTYGYIRIWNNELDKQTSNITIQNGKFRIVWLYSYFNFKDLTELSLKLSEDEYLAKIMSSAPSKITFDNCIFSPLSNDNSAFYTMPGTNHINILNSTFKGKCKGSVVYLNTETSFNNIEGCRFYTKSKSREYISIDGSFNNKIAKNRFFKNPYGAINLYRNTGEGGRVRFTQAHGNIIIENIFSKSVWNYINPVIWKNSRIARRCYSIPQINDDPPYNNNIMNNKYRGSLGFSVRPASNDKDYNTFWKILDWFEIIKWKVICIFK